MNIELGDGDLQVPAPAINKQAGEDAQAASNADDTFVTETTSAMSTSEASDNIISSPVKNATCSDLNPVGEKPLAPSPPRWRFVKEAKKTEGYSSNAAGIIVRGKSSLELGAKYIPPEITYDENAKDTQQLEIGELAAPEIEYPAFQNYQQEIGELSDTEIEYPAFQKYVRDVGSLTAQEIKYSNYQKDAQSVGDVSARIEYSKFQKDQQEVGQLSINESAQEYEQYEGEVVISHDPKDILTPEKDSRVWANYQPRMKDSRESQIDPKDKWNTMIYDDDPLQRKYREVGKLKLSPNDKLGEDFEGHYSRRKLNNVVNNEGGPDVQGLDGSPQRTDSSSTTNDSKSQEGYEPMADKEYPSKYDSNRSGVDDDDNILSVLQPGMVESVRKLSHFLKGLEDKEPMQDVKHLSENGGDSNNGGNRDDGDDDKDGNGDKDDHVGDENVGSNDGNDDLSKGESDGDSRADPRRRKRILLLLLVPLLLVGAIVGIILGTKKSDSDEKSASVIASVVMIPNYTVQPSTLPSSIPSGYISNGFYTLVEGNAEIDNSNGQSQLFRPPGAFPVPTLDSMDQSTFPTIQPLPTFQPSTESTSKIGTKQPSSPTPMPNPSPTSAPSHEPTQLPSRPPSVKPSQSPTKSPSDHPVTSDPTMQPAVFLGGCPETFGPITYYDIGSQLQTQGIVYECVQSQCGTFGFDPGPGPGLAKEGWQMIGSCSGTRQPTRQPSVTPTGPPSKSPSLSPTEKPTTSPSKGPAESPTESPSKSPTKQTTISPSKRPSESPNQTPSKSPSKEPTRSPSRLPSTIPTAAPSDAPPTLSPSKRPSLFPTLAPSKVPSDHPTDSPSKRPSLSPTLAPSQAPSDHPTANPSKMPSQSPTVAPSMTPTIEPSQYPTFEPTSEPTQQPTSNPTSKPTRLDPTEQPTEAPSQTPTCAENGDFNLCIAIDMSGSVCNGITTSLCLDCEPRDSCNSGGEKFSVCCPNFRNMMLFTRDLITELGEQPTNQDFSIVHFGTDVTVASSLESWRQSIKTVNSLKYSGGKTNLAGAITSCQLTLDESPPDRKNLMLILTDGAPSVPEFNAQDVAATAAMNAQLKDTFIIPVFIEEPNSPYEPEVSFLTDNISSDGNVFVADFDGLDDLQDTLFEQVTCQTKENLRSEETI